MEKLLSMMIVGTVGFAIVRTGLLREEDGRQMARLSLYALSPCLIISAFQVELTPERTRGYGAAFLFTMVVQVSFIVLARVLAGIGLVDVVEELSVVYTNCGNLVLPIISMAMGPDMVFYGSAYQISFNLLFWTYGLARMQEGSRIDWKKVFLNPNIVAVAVAMLLALSGLSLPGPIDTAVDMMGSTVGTVGMLVIGMSLAGSSVLQVVASPRAYFVAFLRLIAFPLLALAGLWATGILARHPDYVHIFRISFLAVAAPPAANVAQLAILHDREPVRASTYNLLGTALCTFTMPLIDFLFLRIFQ